MEKKKWLAGYSKYEKKHFPFIYLCVLFPVVQFCIFFIYLNASSIALAFQTRTGEFTFENIGNVFKALKETDMYGFNVGTAIGHSLILWVFSKIIVFPIALFSTYVLFKRIPGHYIFRVIFAVPGIIGSVIWISVLRYMAAYDGPVLMIANKIGLEIPALVKTQGLLGYEGSAFWTMLSFTVLGVVGGSVVITGAMSRIPEEIFESGKIDGVGFFREFAQIAVPCVGSTIAMQLTFDLCGVFVADCGVYLYTNGTGEPNAATMGFYFYYLQVKVSTAGLGKAAFNYPAALGVVISLFTIPIVIVGRKMVDRLFPAVEF